MLHGISKSTYTSGCASRNSFSCSGKSDFPIFSRLVVFLFRAFGLRLVLMASVALVIRPILPCFHAYWLTRSSTGSPASFDSVLYQYGSREADRLIFNRLSRIFVLADKLMGARLNESARKL